MITKLKFEYIRYYLATFVVGQFRQIYGLIRTTCEIWLKNEGLPTWESLSELYFWFLNERGVERVYAIEDLKLLKEHLHELKEVSHYNQRKRRFLNWHKFIKFPLQIIRAEPSEVSCNL